MLSLKQGRKRRKGMICKFFKDKHYYIAVFTGTKYNEEKKECYIKEDDIY